MAIKIFEKYTPRANAPTVDYPVGSIKNESVPGANDGTPLDQAWGNDYAGFDAALLAQGNVTPSGNPDTSQVSDRLQALINAGLRRAWEQGGEITDPNEIIVYRNGGLPIEVYAPNASTGSPIMMGASPDTSVFIERDGSTSVFGSFTDVIAHINNISKSDTIRTKKHTHDSIGGATYKKTTKTGTASENLYNGGTFVDSAGNVWEQHPIVVDPVYFGAPDDINADSTATVQNAINFSAAHNNRAIKFSKIHSIFGPLHIDRPVDNLNYDNYLRLESDESGGLMCRFDGGMISTTIAQTTDDPVCQLVRFVGMRLMGDGNSTNRFILDGNKFLRLSFDECSFSFVRMAYTEGGKYQQSIYINGGNIRRCTETFFYADVAYDVKVSSGTLLEAHSGDAFVIAKPIGCSFIGSNFEGISGRAIAYDQAEGLASIGMYYEGNGRDIDGTNSSNVSYGVTVIGGYHSQSSLGYNIVWGKTLGAATLGNWGTNNLHQYTDDSTMGRTIENDVGQTNTNNSNKVNTSGVERGVADWLNLRSGNSDSWTTTVLYSVYSVREETLEVAFTANMQSNAVHSADSLYITGIPFPTPAEGVIAGDVSINGGEPVKLKVNVVSNSALITYSTSVLPAAGVGDVISVSGTIQIQVARV